MNRLELNTMADIQGGLSVVIIICWIDGIMHLIERPINNERQN